MGVEPLGCQAAQFSLPPALHYLNCAYLGPLPRAAQQSGIAAIGRKANPSTIVPADFFSEAEVPRRLFAQLIRAEDSSRIAIIPAVSYGVAIVARNTPVARGQNIVVVGEDFPSDIYSWRKVAASSGAELRVVGPPPAGPRGAQWNALLLQAIDHRTAVVSVPHVHWTDGTLFDLAAIGRAARASGAALIVDGTQSVGALPFDVGQIQPDALICAGYKWLLGPYSTALAYFGPRYDQGEPLEETWIARKGSEDFQKLIDYAEEYAGGATRYDGGQRSDFILLPMLSAALQLVLDISPERIQDYCLRLVEGPIHMAQSLGYEVEDASWRSAHLFGLRAPKQVDLKKLQQMLLDRQVAVSRRGSALRVSPNVYNTEEDLGALIDVLRQAAK